MKYESLVAYVNDSIDYYFNETNSNPILSKTMHYSLNGGKKLRPAITLAVLQILDPEHWHSKTQVCLIPEFLHTASLLIDDLPAFDNELERRGQKCLHIVENEGIAYLTAMALVTDALSIAHQHFSAVDNYSDLIQGILQNMSIDKAIEGQLMSTDKLSKDSVQSLDDIVGMIDKKTGSFFEIALLVGWVAGGGDYSKINDVKDLAFNLGLCYQIYDDFIDHDEDVGVSKNYVRCVGKEQSYKDFINYQTNIDTLLSELSLECELFEYIRRLLFQGVYDSLHLSAFY